MSRRRLGAIPEWFIAAFAMAYITGYVIELLFYSSMGIATTGSDTFKLHYIYIGIIDFIFIAIFVLPLYFGLLSRAETNAELAKQAVNLPPISSLTVLMFLVYIYSAMYLVVFSQPKTFSVLSWAWIGAVLLILTPTIGFIAMATVIERRAIKTKRPAIETQKRVTLFIIGLIFIFDAYVFGKSDTYVSLLESLFVHAGILYYVVLGLGTFLVWRGVKRTKELKGTTYFYAHWSMLGCLLVVLYFLSAVIFAYTIFPFIPIDKGGGDFSKIGTISFDKSEEKNAPSSVDASTNKSGNKPNVKFNKDGQQIGDYIIVYRTTNSIFLAQVLEHNGPRQWRRHECRPQIFEVEDEKLFKSKLVEIATAQCNKDQDDERSKTTNTSTNSSSTK